MQSLTSTLWVTDSEERGLSLVQPLYEFERTICRHAELEGVALAGAGSTSTAMLRLVSDADSQLAVFVALEARGGNAASHGAIADLRHKWELSKRGVLAPSRRV